VAHGMTETRDWRFQISITAPNQVDSDVRKWLQQAYAQNC
jgi:hypothetical protein